MARHTYRYNVITILKSISIMMMVMGSRIFAKGAFHTAGLRHSAFSYSLRNQSPCLNFFWVKRHSFNVSIFCNGSAFFWVVLTPLDRPIFFLIPKIFAFPAFRMIRAIVSRLTCFAFTFPAIQSSRRKIEKLQIFDDLASGALFGIHATNRSYYNRGIQAFPIY